MIPCAHTLKNTRSAAGKDLARRLALVPTSRGRRGFTLVEAVIGVGLMGLVLVPSLLTIQWSRLQSRNISQEMIAQNLAVALMEMVKRSGYNEIAYGQPLPDVLDTTATNPLLDFPRTAMTGTTVLTALPPGAAGNAIAPEQYRYAASLAPTAQVSSNVNYMRFSASQVAALNGYPTLQAAQDAGAKILDSQLAWGVYIEEHTTPAMTYPVKMLVVIVKWRANYGERVRFTTLRTLVSQRTTRI